VVASLLAACALTHKTAMGLALLWVSPILMPRVWRSRRLLMAVGLGLLILLGLGRRDLAVLGQLFQRQADFSLAVLAPPGRTPLILGHEVALAAGLAVLALLSTRLGKTGDDRLPPLALGFCAFAIFLALPWINIADDQGLGYRLRLAACACLGPCAALLAARVLGRLGPRLRAGGSALAVALVLLRPWTSHEGVVKAHPAMVEATRHLHGLLPPGTIVVIPERHTAFMAAYYGRVIVRLRPPVALDPDHTVRLLPGAAIRPGLGAALDRVRDHPVPNLAPAISLHSMHRHGSVLLPEPTFQHIVAGLPMEEQQWYQAWPVQ